MCDTGQIGHMGWDSDAHPIILKLVQISNELYTLHGKAIMHPDDYPQHMKTLHKAIKQIEKVL